MKENWKTQTQASDCSIHNFRLKLADTQKSRRAAVKSCKEHLETISRLAAEKWGEVWVKQLTKEYCKISQLNGDDSAVYENRRTQIKRAFEIGSCTADTLLVLYHAIDCEIQVLQHRSVKV